MVVYSRIILVEEKAFGVGWILLLSALSSELGLIPLTRQVVRGSVGLCFMLLPFEPRATFRRSDVPTFRRIIKPQLPDEAYLTSTGPPGWR